METKEYLDQAINLSRKALELAPDNSLAHLALGGAYLKKGVYDESIKFLEKALGLNPSPADLDKIYLYLSQSYFAKDSIDQAMVYLKKVIHQKPESLDAYFFMATCCRKKGDYNTAVSCYQKVVSINPRYDYVHSALGSVYLFLGQYQEAIASFQKNMEINGKNHRDLYALGTCYLALKDYDKTMSCLKEIMSKAKLNGWSQLGLGMAHYSKDSINQAIDCYHQVLHTDYAKGLKYHRRATDLLITDLCKEVIVKKVKKRFELRSPQMIPLYLLSIAYQTQGSYDKAIETCQKILGSDPEDNLASFLLGEFYAAQGSSPQAINTYKKILKQDSQDSEAASKLVSIYLEEKQYDLALLYSQIALEIKPDDPLINFQAGLVYWKKGLPYAAQPLLEKAVELESDNLEALFYLGEVYSAMKDQTSTRRVWQKVVDADPGGQWGKEAKAKLKEVK